MFYALRNNTYTNGKSKKYNTTQPLKSTNQNYVNNVRKQIGRK